jgi:hypothetical protein
VSATTVSSAFPLFPSELAVTVAVPGATAVTTPVADTVATEASVIVQAMGRPVSGVPASLVSVAVNAWDSPATSVSSPGATDTDATGTKMTATEALPLFPPELAVIVADPSPIAVTSPVLETEATVSSELAQAIERPASGAPD